MAIDGISKDSSAALAGASDMSALTGSPLTGGGANQSLDKSAFLKLLVAQIQHQDPLKPMDDTAFVAQLAQFSGLEQQMGTNKLLELVALQQKGIANTANTDLVGKSVTIKGSNVQLNDQGLGAPVRFSLNDNAKTVNVTIRNSEGAVVKTIKMDEKAAGTVQFNWDGTNDSGTMQPPGSYTISIDARSAEGAAIGVSQETTGIVQSISFDQGYAALVLDNGATGPTSDLIRVNAPPSTASNK